MASKVGFFTAVNFGNQPKSNTEWLLEKVDGCFYLGGPKAHIIKTDQEAKAVLVNESQSLLMTCLKAASYFTILLPTISLITKAENPLATTYLKALSCFALIVPILLIAKTILRCTHSYKIDAKAIKSLAHQKIDPAVIDTLELDLDEEATVDTSTFRSGVAEYIQTKPFTLRQAATEIIDEINAAIQEKSDAHPQASEQEKHNIVLKVGAPWMKKASNLYFYANCCGVPSEPFTLSTEQVSKLWLNRIIQALVDRKHIQFITSNGHGYFIQA